MEDNRKRNMEKRRETSKNAARDRRGKETEIFTDFRSVVPIVEEGSVTHLDRIALLRVAATVCRLRNTANNVLENELENEKPNGIWNENTISECLDGFVIIADSDSSILYVTESVALYLGLTQTDLTGRFLKDFLHPADYDELLKIAADIHRPKDSDCNSEGINTVLRMKTVISPRGRCLNLKSALFKPISFLLHSRVSSGGHVLLMQGITIPAGQGSANANASAVTKFSDTSTGAFMTRHTCDMRISFASDRFNYILRSDLKSLLGTSFYDLVHPADINIISTSMKELFSKGHIRTPYYRLVASNNTLAWVQTEASTISHTTKGQKGQYIICVHFVLGIQGSEESLVVCTDSIPAGMQVDIKKEVDDSKDYIGRQPEIVECVDFTPLIGSDDPFECETLNPDNEKTINKMGARKDSFDDVLQWLFRDQPSSPPPARYRSLERGSQFNQSKNDDPTLSSVQQNDSTSRSSRSKTSAAGKSSSSSSSTISSPYGRRAQSQGSNNRAPSQIYNYSPLAEGISQCGLNSPPGVRSGQIAYGDTRPLVCHIDTTNPSRRFSAIPAPHVVNLPADELRSSIDNNVFTIVPTTDSNSTINTTLTQTSLNYDPIICDDLQWEEPDLSCLAPFVDTCDMLHMDEGLPPELQALYDLPDFTPSAPSLPAARPVHLHDVRSNSPPSKRTMETIDDYRYQDQYPNNYSQNLFWQPSTDEKMWSS